MGAPLFNGSQECRDLSFQKLTAQTFPWHRRNQDELSEPVRRSSWLAAAYSPVRGLVRTVEVGVAGVALGTPSPVTGPAGAQRCLSDLMRSPWVFRRASRGVTMTRAFELFHDGNPSFGFRLKAPDGTVVAVSGPFPDKVSAVEGIRVVRECAGMGLITDLCPMPGDSHGGLV